MCLLLFKTANAEVPYEFLQNAETNNPHGSGIAIADGTKTLIQKGALWGAYDIAKVLEEFRGHPAIIHFRWATHGNKNFVNTHPFPIDANGSTWVGAHNGVISPIKTYVDESDSRAFLRQSVVPLVKKGIRLDDAIVLEALGKEMGTGNKMCYMEGSGAIGIANEKMGHWKDGVWFSNTSYEKSRTRYSWVDDDDCGGYCAGWHSKWRNTRVSNQSTVGSTTQVKHLGYTAPTKVATAEHENVWHNFQLGELYCDFCNTKLQEDDEFHIEGASGLILCDGCAKSA